MKNANIRNERKFLNICARNIAISEIYFIKNFKQISSVPGQLTGFTDLKKKKKTMSDKITFIVQLILKKL